MLPESYMVCSVGLFGEATPNLYSRGRLVYVYHITDENYQPKFMKYIDDSILKSGQVKYPNATLTCEEFTNQEQVKSVWGINVQKESELLWVIPTVSYENMQDVGYRSVNGETISLMPTFPVSLYMDISGCSDDKFFPFNTIELRYPLTLKREETKSIEALSRFVKSSVMKLDDLIKK